MNRIVLSILTILNTILVEAQTTSFCFGKQMGGTSVDIGYSIKTDFKGNIYTTGLFHGVVDFDPDSGVFNLMASGGSDIFLSKYNPSGKLAWARNMGGTSNDIGKSIAIDPSGNIYVTGTFAAKSDFDPGQDTSFLISNGDDDVFISKLDSLGNFLWTKSIGGAFKEQSTSLAIDSSANIYVTGAFIGLVDFNNPGKSASTFTSNGGNDIFILKLDHFGQFIWAKQIGGIYNEIANSIHIDQNADVYTTGSFDGTVDFNPDPLNVFNLKSADYDDIFISKLDSSGQFKWANRFGGGSLDIGYSIITDCKGNVYTTGEFLGPSDFDPSENQYFLTSNGNSHDVFISKLDESGKFIWAKGFGGNSEEDHGIAISVDSACNIYTTGMYAGTVDFDPGNGRYELSALGNYESFILKLNSNGHFSWSKTLKATSYSYGTSIILDRNDNIYTTGYFAGTTDFNPDAAAFDLTAFGKTDIFIHKMCHDFTENNTQIYTTNFSIFPNPCESSFYVNIPESAAGNEIWTIELLNYQGTSVMTQTSLNRDINIDIKHLAAGLYFVRLTSLFNGNKKTLPLQKIIKS